MTIVVLHVLTLIGKILIIVYLVGTESKWLIRVESMKPLVRDWHEVFRGTQSLSRTSPTVIVEVPLFI